MDSSGDVDMLCDDIRPSVEGAKEGEGKPGLSEVTSQTRNKYSRGILCREIDSCNGTQEPGCT